MKIERVELLHRSDREYPFKDGDPILRISGAGKFCELQLSGGCCSRSFFEDNGVRDAVSLVGQELVSVITAASAIQDIENHDECDVRRYHAVKIRTNQEVVTVDFRNESNGSYDGECEIVWGDEKEAGRNETG